MDRLTKNKELTKRRLIEAVGEIFNEEGYEGLGVNKVAKRAGVNKKLIYRYFGNFNYLVEAFITENDYWLMISERMAAIARDGDYSQLKEVITMVLQNQFNYFLSEPEMQKLILWEISVSSPLMKSIHQAREARGQQMLERTDNYFEGGPVNFRAIAALLVGGIYYMVLHTKTNGGLFCDLDLSTEEGQNQILAGIEQIVGWAFKPSNS